MKRKKIVAGNWKMNKTLKEGQELTAEILPMAADQVPGEVTLVLCVPYIHLKSLRGQIGDQQRVFLGAQNCSDQESGAYTGEVSCAMLASVGTDYVIIGHSERREYYQESNEMLARKIDRALEHGLTPIFCCGESLNIREAGNHKSYVCNQLTESLFHLNPSQFSKLVIAYEPIWAIGTGKTASPEQAQEMHHALRQHLAGKYPENAEDTAILYGGSVKPENAKEIFEGKDVDGGLIGGASLKAKDFISIAKSF